MEHAETLVTLAFQRHKTKTNNTSKPTKTTAQKSLQRLATQTPPNPGMNHGTREGQAVHVSYKTPVMLPTESICVGHHYIRRQP